MTHVVAVALVDRGLLIRTYADGALIVEAPLNRRAALVLLADLANHLLLPTSDALDLEPPGERDIADACDTHCTTKNGENA